jgi:hypothetical protein
MKVESRRQRFLKIFAHDSLVCGRVNFNLEGEVMGWD